MKFLQVFNRYLEVGGEEKSVVRIAEHIEGLGHEVERIWRGSEEWTGEDAPSRLLQIKRMFSNDSFAEFLDERISAQHVDAIIIHNIFPVVSPVVYKVAQKRNIPLIQYIHNFRPFSVGGALWANGEVTDDGLRGQNLKEVLAGSWQDSVLKSAVMAGVLWNLRRGGRLDSVSRWIAISDFVRDKFIEAGVPEEKIITLRHSWDARQDENSEEEQGYYLFLSRLVPEKGVACLLEAWSILEQKLGSDCPRLLIGGNGSDERNVKDIAEHSERISYLGFVSGEEKHSLIKRCRAMVAPSIWWEPLGLVTYESYDYCRPMIAARSGGLTETVVDKVTGLLHEPSSSESLVQSILYMEGLSKEERENMGKNGRDWLLREGNPELWKENFQNIVEEL